MVQGELPESANTAKSYDLTANLAASESGFLRGALQPIVDATTKSILAALEAGQKLSSDDEEAWVKIMMEQEKGLGSASPRGCYPIRTQLNLNHENARWQSPIDAKDPLYLVKNMLNQILDEGRKSLEWELRYPTVKAGKWQENLEKRRSMVRLVIGRPPPLHFVDVEHTDVMQKALNDTKLLREICEGRIPEILKPVVKPVSEWFADTPNTTPYLAIWMSDSDQSSFVMRDPRMNLMSLRVHNSEHDTEPMLPFELNGVFAHALTDGEPAKQRITAIWNSVLASDPKRGVQYQEQGRIVPPEKTESTTEKVKPENPFRKGAFKYPGCEKFALSINIDEIVDKLSFDEQELQALLASAKLLGCKPNSLFMLGLMGVSGAAPVTSVATKKKEYEDIRSGKPKKRRKRIQLTTFGNRPIYDSAQFVALANWTRNSQNNLSLDALFQTDVFQKNPNQLSIDLFQHIGLYESLIQLAQEHDLGFLTNSAKLADRRRVALEELIGLFSPHIIALVRPQMQFSTLGAIPAVGNGALHWEFESACSETVVNTFGLIGTELSLRRFLDNPIGLFDAWQLYIQRNGLSLIELLDFTMRNGFLGTDGIVWLRKLVSDLGQKPNISELIKTTPLEIEGHEFASVHHALAEAGRNGTVMKAVMKFLDDLLGFTADYLQSSANQAGIKKKLVAALEIQVNLTLYQVVMMTESIAYTLLQQNGLGSTQEAAVLKKHCESHKSQYQNVLAELAVPPTSAHM